MAQKGGKTCHICGDIGHFKKDCPQNTDKKGGKKGRDKGKYKKDAKSYKGNKNKVGNSEKTKERLQKIILKTQTLKQKKQKEIQLLDEQEKQLQELLNNADNLDNKTLKDEIKKIGMSFKNKRKAFNDHKKRRKKAPKDKKNKKSGQETKELNKKRKEQKKLQREERKRLKKEKLDKLIAARFEKLPLNKTEIGNNDILYIYVDGYNIIGCDPNCRKNMRGKGGGMKKSRSRLAKLLQDMFLNKCDELKIDYKPIVYLWFDGNGKNHKFGDIEITFSTKKQIVDDKLVEKFSKNDKKQNSNILVITADRELTLRLYNIGVKVIKSSTFYKTYLKEKKEKKDDKDTSNPTDDNDNDDEKKEEVFGESPTSTIDEDAEFAKIIAAKMESGRHDYTPGRDTDDGDNDDDDDAPDEGDNDEDDDEDDEFTEIFGEITGDEED